MGAKGFAMYRAMSLKSAMMTMPVSAPGRVLAVNSQTRTLTLDREITLPSPDHADKPG
ncbi:host specificity J domain protein [Escherichia coli P0304777.7]|nr:host specificity J domain protein [Escherichia coli P0304777.7]